MMIYFRIVMTKTLKYSRNLYHFGEFSKLRRLFITFWIDRYYNSFRYLIVFQNKLFLLLLFLQGLF